MRLQLYMESELERGSILPAKEIGFSHHYVLLYQLTPETILLPNLNKSILSKDEICEQYKRRYVVQGLIEKV